MRRLLSTLLLITIDHDERVPDALLRDLVFHDPARIEQVSRYVIARAVNYSEPAANTLHGLMMMGRQTAWAKLWMLHAVEASGSGNVEGVKEWVLAQLRDRHEIVRAQAAWVAGGNRWLDANLAGTLYLHSSPLSQPALAAAVTRQANVPKDVHAAIVGDAPLNRKAAQWASSQ